VKTFHLAPKDEHFTFDGPFGTFDKAQLQRGFQVYKEVCSNCHALKQIAFRNLADLGYSPAEVKAIAANWATKAKTFDPKTGDA
ncbi:cytochrome c1, partial [Lactococcus petauri]|uniref:cytochrome c1 n=1 Tax=Lactococcus petauri TaxID=1940789 RepID=UPI0021F0BCA3